MGLLGSVREGAKKAKNRVENGIREKTSDVLGEEETFDEENNFYAKSKEDLEEELGQKSAQEVEEDLERLEEKEGRKLVNELESLDSDLMDVLSADIDALKTEAKALTKRKKHEEQVKNKINQIAGTHEDFDHRLEEVIDALEDYLTKTKSNTSSDQVYRSEVGKQQYNGENWQDLVQEARHIRDSLETLDENESTWAKMLDLEEETLEEFKQEWNEQLEALKNFKSEVKTFYGEEEELETIAQKIGDEEAMQELEVEENEVKKIMERMQNIDERINKVDELLSDISYQERQIEGMQQNVEEDAEKIRRMSSEALKQLEKAERMVNGEGEYSEFEFKSQGKWKKEISDIEEVLKSVEELVEKFEEIEEKEISIEQREEKLAQEGAQAGPAVADD